MTALLKVQHLYVSAHRARDAVTVDLVKDVNFTVDSGEAVGLLGASGGGKTLTCLSVARLLPFGVQAQGEISLGSTSLLPLNDTAMAQLRGVELSMVFQEPSAALNPLLTVGEQVTDAACARRGLSYDDARALAAETLGAMGVVGAQKALSAFPHQWSQGMRARALLTAALLVRPLLLLADEPTSALDAAAVGRVLEVLKKAQAQDGMGLLLVSHDWLAVRQTCQRVYVMFAGRIVESGPAAQVLEKPRHPYTARLKVEAQRRWQSPVKTGALSETLAGCPYRGHCSKASERCSEMPTLETVGPGHQVACFHGETL
ncbi:MAG: ABC transporter ATP-binding protein [Myxococcaceae bacterium]|nr:ABC transporter ATP-binding protein [Myxococcaceae bacterium]